MPTRRVRSQPVPRPPRHLMTAPRGDLFGSPEPPAPVTLAWLRLLCCLLSRCLPPKSNPRRVWAPCARPPTARTALASGAFGLRPLGLRLADLEQRPGSDRLPCSAAGPLGGRGPRGRGGPRVGGGAAVLRTGGRGAVGAEPRCSAASWPEAAQSTAACICGLRAQAWRRGDMPSRRWPSCRGDGWGVRAARRGPRPAHCLTGPVSVGLKEGSKRKQQKQKSESKKKKPAGGRR